MCPPVRSLIRSITMRIGKMSLQRCNTPAHTGSTSFGPKSKTNSVTGLAMCAIVIDARVTRAVGPSSLAMEQPVPSVNLTTQAITRARVCEYVRVRNFRCRREKGRMPFSAIMFTLSMYSLLIHLHYWSRVRVSMHVHIS